VFVEADHDGQAVLDTISARPDLPPPSYVLHSSPNRLHVFWRAKDFSIDQVERLQKQLAREFGTDPAATSASQATRLAGFLNHKHSPANLVTIDYHDTSVLRSPNDFPIIESREHHSPSTPPWTRRGSSLVPAERARR
jgi:hypothetical protein